MMGSFVAALQVEKAKKREETAVVAVVELLSAGKPSGSKFLLLQRPKDGLLAGVGPRHARFGIMVDLRA